VDRLFRWEQLAKETLDVYQQTVARFRAENAIVTSEFEKNLSQQN
jgi:hypothetical protein